MHLKNNNSSKIKTMCEVTLEDFASSFGTTVSDIPKECRKMIEKCDFNYTVLQGVSQEKVILDVLKKIDADQQIIGAAKRQNVWDNGWSENLQDFIDSGYNLNALVPKFIRPNQAIRFNQKYIMPVNEKFELDYFSVFRLWLFKKYLKEFNSIYEFGCGTGFNLVVLGQLYPEKELHGLDFVPSSKKLVDSIARHHNLKIKGHVFDMILPDDSLDVAPNSAIFTIGAIEQLASRIEPLLQFFLKKSPKLCIHVEPTIELYDENNLVDYLAIKFHKKRGYTQNYLTRLRELECEGKVEIIKVKRLYFGSLYMEGYSCIIWKPKKG